HGSVGGLSSHARRAALGLRRIYGLADDRPDIQGKRFHRAGAADVAYRPEAHRKFFALLAGFRDEEIPILPHDLAPVRVVERRHRELLALDVLPDVELGPVRDREHAHVLALVHAPVVEVPELGPLVLRVPLAELVAKGKNPLLGARLFLVAPRAAD